MDQNCVQFGSQSTDYKRSQQVLFRHCSVPGRQAAQIHRASLWGWCGISVLDLLTYFHSISCLHIWPKVVVCVYTEHCCLKTVYVHRKIFLEIFPLDGQKSYIVLFPRSENECLRFFLITRFTLILYVN